MTTKTIKFDKDGLPIRPEVKIGNERLSRSGSSQIAPGFVVCDEHGTTPRCWVKHKGLLAICCRLCVLQNCPLTKAVLRPCYSASEAKTEGVEETPEGTLMDHPDGHSF